MDFAVLRRDRVDVDDSARCHPSRPPRSALTQPTDESHSVIKQVTVTIGDTTTTVDVPPPDSTGRSTIEFPATTAAQLSLTVADIEPRTTIDRRYAETTVLPVAINELESPSIATPTPLTAPPECRSDLIEIDGVSAADLGRPGDDLRAVVGRRGGCTAVRLALGVARLRLPSAHHDCRNVHRDRCRSDRLQRRRIRCDRDHPYPTVGFGRPDPHDAHRHRVELS